MGLKGFLNHVFPGRPPLYPAGEEWKATREEIRRLASPCPVCNQIDLNGHQYAEFASQLAAEVTDELKQFFALFREHRWQELRQIREFEGRWNAAIIYAVFCHRGGYMMAVRDPVELYDSSSIIEVIRFNEDEAGKIRSLLIELHDL
jgi:hypothetical protein